MGQAVKACRAALSAEEQASLKKMCACGCRKDIPGEHADKFLELGLAELSCGDLQPTASARVALHRLSA